MGISVSSLKGYLLEEALSKLIHHSGYTLLTSVNNSDDLKIEGNGLNVIGRGGLHQADVLGQFPFNYPFTYPIRLFVEAKFQESKAGIDVVRKGIGIIQDLNQNYKTALVTDERELLIQRFNYNYSIFSTSGFSSNAINLAIAHKIHLVDLSGVEYSDLKREISDAAESLMYIYNNDIPAKYIQTIRKNLRNKLFSNMSIDERNDNTLSNEVKRTINRLNRFIQGYSDLYLASNNTPFVILLKPSNPVLFKELIRKRQNLRATIRWDYTSNEENSTTWYIYLYSNNSNQREDVFLTFKVPSLIENLILKSKSEQETLLEARYSKQVYLSRFIFFTKVEENEFFVNIKYDIS